ncbi:type I-E CRISPR-associated protein Cas6/Cse3/CasE [Streptomyces lavendulae]|uniref:type I-E CRISPR-associated protein Cas6/Cse3/CasE n=1 Tax=Streptomyces lavendulae TaxID=1914 RepID=UPI00337B7F5C
MFSKATGDPSGNSGGRTTVTLDIVDYEGTLTVTDPALLAQTLLAGIGSGKAYGCGMLTLARPAS